MLAPHGRDAALARALLGAAKIEAKICKDIAHLSEVLSNDVGFVLFAEESTKTSDLSALAAWIKAQPAWSDLPFVLITEHGGGPERNPACARMLEILGNLTFLERPFHPTTLISVARTALRARHRQFEARSRLEALSEGEERLRTALRGGRLGAWEFNSTTQQLVASELCKAHFGWPVDQDFSFADVMSLIHPDDVDAVRSALTRSFETGDDYVQEFRVIWPDGTIHWIDARAHILNNERTKTQSMIGVSSDVTERRNAQAAREKETELLETHVQERTRELAEQKSFLDVMIQSVPAGIVTYNKDLRIMTWNPVAENLTGIPASKICGQRLNDVVPSLSGGPMQRMREAVEGRSSENVEQQLVIAETGKRAYYDVKHAPLRSADGAVIGGVAFMHDITARRQVEEQLRQSQKMEAIGQLTGGVAHDFNNLLMAVLGNLELLKKRTLDNAKLQKLIDGAIHGAERGAALTQRLLAFARRQDLNVEAVRLEELVLNLRELLQRSSGPQVNLKFDLPKNLPRAKVDRNQLELALLNLVVNARDAMPNGGDIRIRLKNIDVSAHNGLNAGSYLVLSVEDTGTGMDEETLKQAIDPFFSTKQLGKGTGLGLSMVHGLAIQLGGRLHLSSVLGKGTTAELWLPVSDLDETASAAPQAESQTLSVAPRSTILVVDDDALIAMNAVDLLEDLGHKVIEANSGAVALQILENNLEIDLLMTDHAMPGMTGVELAKAARLLRPGLPILLATGYAEMPNGAGIDLPRLDKPYHQKELAAQLAKLLAH